MSTAEHSTDEVRLAIVERDVAMLTTRVDDYHERLQGLERLPDALARERGRVDTLSTKADATTGAIHALDLRLTSFTSRMTALGGVAVLLVPLLTALLMRWIAPSVPAQSAPPSLSSGR